MYQLVLDRSIGTEYKVPDNVWVIGAGNGLDDGAISYEMGSALTDRFIHFNVICEAKQWLEWAKANDIAKEVLTFISIKPDYLDQALIETTADLNAASDDKAINPSPRSWAKVSKVIKQGISKTSLDYIIPGIVGNVASVQFATTLDELGQLPPMDKLFSCDDKELRKILPTKASGMYGLCYSVPAYCDTAEKFIRAFHIFNVFVSIKDGRNRSEIQALAAELLSKRLNTKYVNKFSAQVTSSDEFATLVKHAEEFTNFSYDDIAN